MTAATCALCGDPLDPAECPDRAGWDDHCLSCIGSCPACQDRIDQGDDL